MYYKVHKNKMTSTTLNEYQQPNIVLEINPNEEEKVADKTRIEIRPTTTSPGESKFIITHPKSYPFCWWLRLRKAAVANPSRDGISCTDLIDALKNWNDDLGGVETIIMETIISKRIGHEDRELGEFWLKRVLTEGEDLNDWDIQLLVKEFYHDGHGCIWYKTMLQNRKTKKYSGRSFALFVGGDEPYFTEKLSRTRSSTMAAMELARASLMDMIFMRVDLIINSSGGVGWR